MSNRTDWNAKAAREGERRREERPHYVGDTVVRYRRLWGDGEYKAAIVIEIPGHDDMVVIGPLPSSIAKEIFDSIGDPAASIAPLEIKVGDLVRVRGDSADCTDHLDGAVGVVVGGCDERSNDYYVKFDGDEGTWCIWSYNIVEVLKR